MKDCTQFSRFNNNAGDFDSIFPEYYQDMHEWCNVEAKQLYRRDRHVFSRFYTLQMPRKTGSMQWRRLLCSIMRLQSAQLNVICAGRGVHGNSCPRAPNPRAHWPDSVTTKQGRIQKKFLSGEFTSFRFRPIFSGVEGWGGLIIFCLQIHSKNIWIFILPAGSAYMHCMVLAADL